MRVEVEDLLGKIVAALEAKGFQMRRTGTLVDVYRGEIPYGRCYFLPFSKVEVSLQIFGLVVQRLSVDEAIKAIESNHLGFVIAERLRQELVDDFVLDKNTGILCNGSTVVRMTPEIRVYDGRRGGGMDVFSPTMRGCAEALERVRRIFADGRPEDIEE